ncbi:MAG: hypothetical protein H7Z16_00170 [Pyrinomonadaceae bacterium]|nr:hypothetical protein [Pyrinomonadaceae bacterium]
MALTNSNSKREFASWAFSTARLLRKAVGVGFVLAAAISIRHLKLEEWSTLQPGNSMKAFFDQLAPQRANLAFIQAAACLLLALMLPRASTVTLAHRKGVSSLDRETAQKASQRIHSFVLATYLAWSLYYLITGLSLTLDQSHFDQAISVTLNTVPSLLLFWLYIELAELTIDDPTPSEAGRKTEKDKAVMPATGGNVYYRVVSVGVFALVVVPVWYASSQNNPNDPNAAFIRNIFDVFSSCLNGVALALVVGRLGSKIIDPGSITLGLLYFYAVIQPTAAAFHDNPVAHLLATTVALPLKVLLWLVFVWAFTTGILAEYVHEIRILLIREQTSRQVSWNKETPL